MKRFILLIIIALAPIFSQAQWNVGVEAGAGFSNLSGSRAESNANSRAGLKIGVIGSYTARYGLYVESGLSYANRKGGILSHFDNQYKTLESVDSKLQYLQLPVNLGYKIRLSKKWAIIPKAGMWVAVGVGGHSIVTGTETSGTRYQVRVLPFNADRYTLSGVNYNIGGFSRLDWGMSVGADVRYNRLAIRAACDFGLQDLNFDLGSPHSRTYNVSFGYFF